MKKWQTYTAIISVLIVLVIAVYDVIAIAKGGTEASISHMIIVMSYKYPAVPFSFGFLCGHLFWRMSDTAATKKIRDFIKGKE